MSLALPWEHNDIDGYTSGFTTLFGERAEPVVAALVLIGGLGAPVGLAGVGMAAALIADHTIVSFGVERASGQFTEQWVDSTPSYGVFLYAGAGCVRRLTKGS